jgi:hypothetical protein
VRSALRELEYIIRDKHIGKTTEQEFGSQLDPTAILSKYRADERLDSRVREHTIQGILDRLSQKTAFVECSRNMALERVERSARLED